MLVIIHGQPNLVGKSQPEISSSNLKNRDFNSVNTYFYMDWLSTEEINLVWYDLNVLFITFCFYQPSTTTIKIGQEMSEKSEK